MGGAAGIEPERMTCLECEVEVDAPEELEDEYCLRCWGKLFKEAQDEQMSDHQKESR